MSGCMIHPDGIADIIDEEFAELVLYCEIFGLDDEGVSKYGKLSAVAIMLRDALVKCADSATDYSGMYVGGLPVDPDCIVDARKALKLAKDIGL